MTAIQFINTPTIKLKSPKDFKPNREITEEIRLNYSIITLMTREISDTLSVYADKKIISNKDVAYFEKLANGDNDHLFDIYKKHGFIKEASDDFLRITAMFQSLAKRSLSQYQATAEPKLVEMLSVIYGMGYIQIAIPKICASIGRTPEANTFRIIKEKKKELENLFMHKYRNVSNQKVFDFSQFAGIVSKLLKMNRTKFIEFTDNLTNEDTTTNRR